MNTQNHPQLRNPVAQEDKRLFVPEDSPIRDQLLMFFTNPDFQLIKAGFDHYKIPLRYNPGNNQLKIGEKDLCKIDCACLKDTTSYSRVVISYVIPTCSSLLVNCANQTIREMSASFAAYQRLNAASLAYYDANRISAADTDYAELWQLFDDLVTLGVYIFRENNVQICSVGTDGLAFCFQYQEQNGSKWPTCIQFDLKSYRSIFNTLDTLRAHYLYHHHSVTWNTEIIQQILADYRQVADRHVCKLNFIAMNDPITLLAVRHDRISFMSFDTDLNAPQSLLTLMPEIRNCSLKSDTEDADALIAKLTEKVGIIPLNSTTTMQELFQTAN